MKTKTWSGRWIVGLSMFLAAMCFAQRAGREVSVLYLRAAVGGLDDRDRVTVTGEYVAADGLRETTERFLRGKGFSRFSVRAQGSDVVFTSMYCDQKSRAFETLVDITGVKVCRFIGYRSRGEEREAAIVVTDVKVLHEITEDVGDDDREIGARRFRITMTDNATSNSTVLVNVELGKRYNVLGTTLVIEDETPNDQGGGVVDE